MSGRRRNFCEINPFFNDLFSILLDKRKHLLNQRGIDHLGFEEGLLALRTG
jgi:hypothetical protein